MKNSTFAFCLFVLMVTTLSSSGQLKIGIGSTAFKKTQTIPDWDYSQPQEYILEGISVTGVQFLSVNEVIAISGLKVGDAISVPGDQIAEAIKRLWKEGLVGDVTILADKIEGRSIWLQIAIKERPRLSRFDYKGVKKSDKESLNEKISYSRGRIVSDAMIKNTQKKVQDFYVEKGYLDAEVSVKEELDTSVSNTVALEVNVKKGDKVRIHEIHFIGASKIDPARLKKKMKETKEKHWYNPFTSSKLIQKEFQNDLDLVIAYYNSKGYRDAVILSDSVSRYNSRSIDIHIQISEGKMYFFRNITWKGNYLYKTSTLDSILNIRKGEPYNREKLDRKLSFNPNGLDISSLYLDRGYLFFNVDPVEVRVDGDSIDIEMRIYEGDQATINRITIAGNTKTHDHVIQREIRTLPGNKFSRADLIRSQQSLMALNYFNPEKLGINPVPDPRTSTVDIHYSVEEKPSDQIELSGGWGGNFGFIGTVGLVFNNFSASNITKPKTWDPLPSGDGQRLSLRLQANGRQFQTYSISLTEPWLGGRKPNSLTVSLQHSVQNRYQGSGFSAQKTESLKLSGVTVSLGKRLKWPDDFFSISFATSVLQYRLKDWSNGSQDLGFSNGVANNLTFNTTITRADVDNFQFPTRGSRTSLSMTFTPPYSSFNNLDYSDPALPAQERYKWVEYHKWMFDTWWYTTLLSVNKKSGTQAQTPKRNLVLNFRYHIGVVAAYNQETGVGPFDRFVMGGSGLSGFNFLLGYDVIGLRGYPDNSITRNGGTVFDKYVAEIAYPVMESPALSLYLHTFFEAGNNWADAADFNPFNTYRAAGIGARVFMPAFGLIGFDYGWPFDQVPGVANPDLDPRFTFTIGQQIR